jgi:hypothetical protein
MDRQGTHLGGEWAQLEQLERHQEVRLQQREQPVERLVAEQGRQQWREVVQWEVDQRL